MRDLTRIDRSHLRPFMRVQRRGEGLVSETVAKRERYVDRGVEVLRVERIGDSGPGTATIRRIDRHGEQLVQDEGGQIRKVGDGWPPTRWIFYLGKVDNRWKVFRIEDEGPER